MMFEEEVLACCTISYSHPIARWLLGDSFHPGGLELTTRLAELTGIGPASRVLDAGAGRGASAVHLAKTWGCRVVGVTLEQDGVTAGYQLAQRHQVEDRVTFIQGDIQQADLGAESFDVVLMECVLSILPRKVAALRRLHDLLGPGGRLVLTDVTVSGALPPDLQGVLAVAGCLGDARSLEEYRALLQAEGFIIDQSVDLQDVVSSFLRDIGGKLLMAEIAIKLGKLPLSNGAITEGKRILAEVQYLIQQGVLSYGLVVAQKPNSHGTGANRTAEAHPFRLETK